MKNAQLAALIVAAMVWAFPGNAAGQEGEETTGDVVNAVQEVMAPKPPAPAPQETAAAEPEYMDSMPSDDEVNAIVADASKPEVVDPSMKLQGLISSFEKEGLGKEFKKMKRNVDGFFYGVGYGTVLVPSTHPDWVDYRVSAFREAYMDALGQYLQEKSRDVETSIASTLIEDSEMPEFEEGELKNSNKVESIVDKLLAYGDKYLDGKLEKLEVDPKEFDAAPPSKKKTLMMNAITVEATTRSLGDLVGVIPVKTFEADNGDGDYVVAVAVVASYNTKRLALKILAGGGNIKSNPKRVGGPSIEDQILGNDEALLQEFGVRRIYDQDGYPVLISYGQSGNSRSNERNYSVRMQYRKSAFGHAEMAAEANFALFMDAFGNKSKTELKKSIQEEVGKVTAHKDKPFGRRDVYTEMIKSLKQKMRVEASINNFPGIYELHRWIVIHPENKQEVEGIVLAWSPRSASSAMKLREIPQQEQTTVNQKQTGKASGRVSKDLMSPDDF